MIKFRVLYFHNLYITHNENNPLSQNSNQLGRVNVFSKEVHVSFIF